MKKQVFLLFAGLFGFNCYSQIVFEKGHYIDNSDHRVDCLIKNKDWESNPNSLIFKLSEDSEQLTLQIDSAKEFAIHDKTKYIRARVHIDRSSDRLSELDHNNNPVYSEEVLFLKVLLEGKANLYGYFDKGLTRFFFSTDSLPIQQLVCKSYLNSANQISKNGLFRQQLMASLSCTDLPVSYYQALEYTREDLIDFFTKYNECHNLIPVLFEKKQKRDLFNLTLLPGFRHSSMWIKNDAVYFREVDFDGKYGFTIGAEAEFIFPFNNNKWAMFIEPTYQYYKSTGATISNINTGEGVTAAVDYKSIEIPFGLRYYVFLNSNSKVFFHVAAVFDSYFNSSLIVTKNSGFEYMDFTFNTKNNYITGLGFKFKDRYRVEVNYHTKRKVLSHYDSWSSGYHTAAIVLGYSFF